MEKIVLRYKTTNDKSERVRKLTRLDRDILTRSNGGMHLMG